jgi:S-adenosylmethionine-diacylglycerol 3-amino-3-carboxypropyl transferase
MFDSELENMPLSPDRRIPQNRLKEAVARQNSPYGLLERLFAFVFKGLVYPQIWEDPEVDMRALALRPDSRLVTIASGGCNVLSYLIADPKDVTAVDLNTAHVALTRLKLTAGAQIPIYETFYRFFGVAEGRVNLETYERFIRDHLDPETQRYWESRNLLGRRRIAMFARDLYRHGLLGHFIGLSHWIAKLYGIDPNALTSSKGLEEQRAFFNTALLPLFDKRLVRWATSKKVSLYGLGIPPAQYDALASEAGGDMAVVLKQRLERLACDFDLSDNYFAWQAFARQYAPEGEGPLPPYLKRSNFDVIRARADRVTVLNRSFTEHLEHEAPGRLDAYVLLDAQDWMTDAQLNALWAQITRTARPGARVIFRTAARPSLLPGRVDDAILSRWTYRGEDSGAFGQQDRSSIYGGFHLYVFNG